ncbi:MAG: TetR/AcrR family transcriptional regulator [Wenzhouxiangellaceae bacterium]|nr:TetR/AcrR family transcriptional regulator [Wenzhouxiangellaceae bacterium]
MDRQKEEAPHARAPGLKTAPDDARADPIDATVRLFWEKGFNNSSLCEIEAATGMTLARIRELYGGRSALLQRALQRYGELIERELLTPLERSNRGLDALHRFFHSLHAWVTNAGRRGCLLINMMAETDCTSPVVCDQARDASRRLERAFHAALTRAQRNGDLTRGPVEQRAQILVGLVLGLNIAARGGATDRELERMFESVRMQLRLWRVS